MRVDTLTPVLDAAPGEFVMGRVRVVNDGADEATFTMRVVGLDGQGTVYEVPGGPVGPGLSAEVEVPLEVPAALGVGHHAVALEVSSDRADERPALARLTVSIDSLERVQLSPRPSTVRAGRSGRFTLDVLNNEPTTVDVLLGGGAPDVAVAFEPPSVRLHPGERGWVRGRIRARQRWSGDSLHHVVTLTARGRSSTTSTTMAYIQRPVVPGKARNAVAAFVVVALFLGAIGGGLWWWSQRDTTETADTSNGQLDQLDGTATNADGSTGSVDGATDGATDGGSGGGGGGGGSGGGGTGGDDADAPAEPSAIPTFTVVTGTVSTTDGAPQDVTVRLAPIDLGAPTDDAIVGVAGASRGPAKIWSARHAVRPSVMTPVRQTESVTPSTTTGGDGVWRFADIPIRQNYELVFSKPGYDTQSFVVTPPDDGSRVELDVELAPGTGQLSGVIVGPDGPLGGVDIVVTDGDLTFRTTSATAASGTGQVGSFAIEGLNTPAVYTLSATLRGYGTEVVQLPFTPGQDRSGTTIAMQPGVGSISGRVTSGGEPQGGVTITASNGDDTFTTTTLTEGDVGAYTIPRLDIPGEYTVTATQDGFITDTRRVELTGNVTGIDYQLVPTTAGISGRVLSSNGTPLVGAGVRVSVDDIGFRSATAASPVPGSFNIDDLPPGTYLVRIDRFDHLPFSQQVTVGAGQTADLGDITLEFSARPPIAAIGSIAVRVFDSEDSDLEGATVSLYAPGDVPGRDEPIDSIADEAGEQSTFVFENVPIGTYRVRVTRPVYRTVERRVSVGLGRENVEVRMLRLGQASGQIVTADGQPLRDYVLRLSRVEPSGSLTFVEDVTVVGGQPPDEEGNILWESAPNSLVTGTYRIDVLNQPAGYVVEPNQVIDPTVTESPASMLFRVPADSEEPVRVDDLVADPLPLIGGRFFVPRYDPSTRVTTMVALENSERDQLGGLAVTLVCDVEGTEVPVAASIPPTPDRDAIRPYPGFSLPPVSSQQFEITPFAIQDADASGSCRLDVESDDFVDVSVPLAGDVVPTPGAGDPRVRAVNVALLRDARPFFGNVFWRDRGVVVPLSGVDVRSDAATVLGANVRQGDSFDSAPPPEIVRGALSTTSGALGEWDLGGQRFGSAVYTFTADDFSPGTLRVTYDDEADPTEAPDRDIESLSGLIHTVRGDDGVDVELTAPDPGPLSGQVSILTTRPAAQFADVGRRAEGPGGDVIDPVPYSGAATGGGTVPWVRGIAASDPVAAGTWEVTFGVPDNHAPFAGAPTVVEERVQPASGADGFSTQLVELGLIDVDLAYDTTPGSTGPTGTSSITLRRDDATTGPIVAPATSAPDEASYDRVAVHPATPLSTPVDYFADTVRSGFDESDATVVVTDRTDPGSPVVQTVPGVASRNVDLGVLAGTDLQVTVTLPQYGTITGTVLGEGFTTDVLQVEDGLLDVTALPVVDGVVQAPDPRVSISGSGDAASSFTVSAPPGTYEITVSHPFFKPDPVAVPVGPDGPERFAAANTEARTVDDEWVLESERSALEVSVLGSFDADESDPDRVRVPVQDARVTLSRPGDASFTPIVVPSGADGAAMIDDLLPGTYQLEVRRLTYVPAVVCPEPPDPFVPCTPSDETWTGDDRSYPVLATLDVTPGATPEDRTLSVEVVLPSLTGKIDGTVIAVNSEWDPDNDDPVTLNQVAVPLGDVTREFVPSAVSIAGGGTVPNEVDPDTITPEQVDTFALTGAATAIQRAFVFENVPGGTHRLTFPIPAGYTLEGVGPPDDDDVTIVRQVDDTEDVAADTEVNVVYRALDVSLVVELDYRDGVDVVSPQVVLQDADGNDLDAPVVDDTTFTFTGVPPSTRPYVLLVSDDLAGPSGGSDPIAVEVVPNGDGLPTTPADAPVQVERVDMAATVARVTGNIQQTDAQGSPAGALTGPAQIVVRTPSGDPVGDPIVVANGENRSSYSFDLDDPGTYDVTVVKDGYTSSTESVNAVLGETRNVPTLVVRKFATATVEVGNADASTTVVVFPVTNPSAETAGVRSGSTWTFDELTPGVGYRFRVNRSGYYQVFFPSATTQLTPGIGVNTPYDAGTLIERVLNVSTTSGLANGTSVTATVTIGSTTLPAKSANVTGGTPAPSFTFRSTDSNGLPLTGGGAVVLSANGFRSQSLAIPTFADPFVAAGTAASARTQDLTLPLLRPNVTTVTGTLTGTDAAVDVSLSGPGGLTATATSSGGSTNTYTFPTGTYPVGTYTVVVDELGVGTGSETLEITAGSPTTATATVPSFAVVARDVTVTFTGAPATADVFVGSTELTLDDTDPVTFTRSERQLADTYEVRNAGSVWTDVVLELGDIDVDSETGALSVTEAVSLAAFPTFGGTVTDADGDVDGAVVTLYRGGCASSTREELDSETTDEDGEYSGLTSSAGGPADTYCIEAVFDGRSDSEERTVPGGSTTVALVIPDPDPDPGP